MPAVTEQQIDHTVISPVNNRKEPSQKALKASTLELQHSPDWFNTTVRGETAKAE